jgi:hypothetical protein
MNPGDIESLVQRWAARGFEVMESRDGEKGSQDNVCVAEAMFGGPTLPCDWVAVEKDARIAYLKAAEPGVVVGREEITTVRDPMR